MRIIQNVEIMLMNSVRPQWRNRLAHGQWRNRLAHGTYKADAVSDAGVVSSSLTWGTIFFCTRSFQEDRFQTFLSPILARIYCNADCYVIRVKHSSVLAFSEWLILYTPSSSLYNLSPKASGNDSYSVFVLLAVLPRSKDGRVMVTIRKRHSIPPILR